MLHKCGGIRLSFLNELNRDGLTIFRDMFKEDIIRSLNEEVSSLLPAVGNVKDKGWHNWQDVQELAKTQDLLTEVDWSYFWSITPQDNVIINDTILPVIENIANDVFKNSKWGWQLTNRYIMSNYNHDMDVQPHLDAPYLWPQKLECQMNKYLPKGIKSLTFMIPLTDFTVENGATAYALGSHKYHWDTEHWNEAKPVNYRFFKDNCIQPEVSAGSFAAFHGNLMHSIMSNKTNSVRRGIIYRAIRQDALDEMERLGLG
jgi:hypothetical protein